MKAKVTFYVMPSHRVEVSEVESDPVEVSVQEKLALEVLCSGACGFKDEHSVNFGLIDRSAVWNKIMDGGPDMKDTFMLDPDTATPVSEDDFKDWFNDDYAELILERAADMLTGELSDYYFANASFTTKNANGDLVEQDILPASFIAVEFISS